MKFSELKQSIIISDNFNKIILFLNSLKINNNFFLIDKRDEEFLIEDTKNAINESYIKREENTYIILLAKKFSLISQNKLLKIVEEPPPNKFFIIITSINNNLIPTIKSRFPIFFFKDTKLLEKSIDLDLQNLTLEKIYNFYKKKNRHSKDEIKREIEQISLAILRLNSFKIDNNLLNFFQESIISLEINLNPQFILFSFLYKILKHKI